MKRSFLFAFLLLAGSSAFADDPTYIKNPDGTYVKQLPATKEEIQAKLVTLQKDEVALVQKIQDYTVTISTLQANANTTQAVLDANRAQQTVIQNLLKP